MANCHPIFIYLSKDISVNEMMTFLDISYRIFQLFWEGWIETSINSCPRNMSKKSAIFSAWWQMHFRFVSFIWEVTPKKKLKWVAHSVLRASIVINPFDHNIETLHASLASSVRTQLISSWFVNCFSYLVNYFPSLVNYFPFLLIFPWSVKLLHNLCF